MTDLDARHSTTGASEPADPTRQLDLGRRAFDDRTWADAYRGLRRADAAAALEADDLERLATSAYLVGRDADYLRFLGRAYAAHAGSGARRRALRCAFWLGLQHTFRGEMGPAGGWFGRAQDLLDKEKRQCVEHGYLLLPQVERQLGAGEPAAAYETACRAGEIGERFGDADLVACAGHLQGRALIRQWRVADGLTRLDAAMVAVTAGELTAIMTGLIYCSVIRACQQVCAFDRARSWTNALAIWCAEQPQMVAFTSACLVHRAEIMRLAGTWDEAFEEAGRACAAVGDDTDLPPPADAHYQRGEVHRLRGDIAAAEAAYREANRLGFEPQPGLALLRLAEGRTDDALSAIRRALDATGDALRRSRLLPAQVEIALAAGEIDEARRAARELRDIARRAGTEALRAMAAEAEGSVALADGAVDTACGALRTALAGWREIGAPYEAARVRMAMGLACRAVGDGGGAEMELDASRAVFERLGAMPDLARVDALLGDGRSAPSHGLTRRELEVVRLVATGKTNKEIAEELSLSVRTVDRHLENVFTKLDLPSRAAATAYAFRHKIV